MAIDANDPTADRTAPHPRSRIADVVLADAPAHLDADEVEALLDVVWSATEAACLSRTPGVEHPTLLDWDEYVEVRL